MVTTRTRISEDYIKPASCPTGFGASYIRPSCVSPCYRSSWWSPFSFRTRYVEPIYVSDEPPVVVQSSAANRASSAAAAIFMTAFVVGIIALAILVPSCHVEEVYRNAGWDRVCHLEKVCHSIF